jgi:hypothetical protein
MRAAAAFGAALLLVAVCCSGDDECADRASCAGPAFVIGSVHWERISDAPGGARQEVAAAVVAGKIYVVGGLVVGGSATRRVEVYDPSTKRWSQAAPLPIALHHAMATALEGKLYVIGGFAEGLGGRASREVFVFDGTRWSAAPPLTRARGAGAAVTIDGKIYVVGGISGNAHVSRVDVFDGEAWLLRAAMPEPYDHIAAAIEPGVRAPGYLHVVGGRRGGRHFGTLQRYDIKTNQWSIEQEAMPTARSGLGAAYVATNGARAPILVAIGGEGPRMFPEVEALQPRTGWVRLTDMGVPRHGIGVVAIGRTIYALLGGTEVGLAPSAASEALRLTFKETP